MSHWSFKLYSCLVNSSWGNCVTHITWSSFAIECASLPWSRCLNFHFFTSPGHLCSIGLIFFLIIICWWSSWYRIKSTRTHIRCTLWYFFLTHFFLFKICPHCCEVFCDHKKNTELLDYKELLNFWVFGRKNKAVLETFKYRLREITTGCFSMWLTSGNSPFVLGLSWRLGKSDLLTLTERNSLNT